MRRLSILCAAASLTAATLAVTSSAQAAYHLIKWQDTGFCQIWDENIPSLQWPSNYTKISASVPTIMDAISMKDGMVRTGTCAF